MKRLLGLTILALILFSLCLQGARWQFDRYESRHDRNELIRDNFAMPKLAESDLPGLAPNQMVWREIEVSGSFQPETEMLVRNRYHLERYGLGVVTLFVSQSGKKYWVDRGWVAPGPDATTPPITKPVTDEVVTLIARIRLEDIENQIGGSVFALPNSSGENQLSKWNRANAIDTESIYFDLIKSSNPDFDPDFPTTLPTLSDGPHLAYSLQWLLFAGFVLFGYLLVIREDRKVQREKA